MMSLAQTQAADGTVQLATVKERHLKAPIVLAAATALLALLVLLVPRSGTSTFRLGDASQSFELPDVGLPTGPTIWVSIAILVVLVVASALLAVWTLAASGSFWRRWIPSTP